MSAPLLAAAPVLAILRALIEERTGLSYGTHDYDNLLDRAGTRAVEAGFDSLLGSYYYLRYDAASGPEFDKLIDALVVNETYFFREYEQLRVIFTEFIQAAIARGRRPRIWSAACATGEEPLTLAMLLADQGLLHNVEIVASDISPRALERAQSKRYSRRAVRDLPDPLLARRWIKEEPDGTHSLARELIDAVSWRRVNLSVDAEVAALGIFDVVLCRKVMI